MRRLAAALPGKPLSFGGFAKLEVKESPYQRSASEDRQAVLGSVVRTIKLDVVHGFYVYLTRAEFRVRNVSDVEAAVTNGRHTPELAVHDALAGHRRE